MPSPEQIALTPVLRDVHHYWFGELASPTDQNPEKAAIWFRQSDETGDYGAGTYIVNAAGTEHSVWSDTGCVVLIQWDRPVTIL